MFTPSQIQMLDTWLSVACEGVGGAFFQDARPLETQHPQFENLAIVGFAGDNIKGSLGVAADWQVLSAFLTKLQPGAEITNSMMLDTLGEIANQVLGRVKNTFASHSVEVSMTIPMVVQGLRLTIAGSRQELFLQHNLDTANGLVSIWMDVKSTDDIEFIELKPEEQSSEEGDMMLFF